MRQGTSFASLVLILMAVALSACGEEDESTAPDPALGTPPTAKAQRLADACAFDTRSNTSLRAEAIRDAFVPGLGKGDGGNSPRLLLNGTLFAPGEEAVFVVENLGEKNLLYGLGADLVDAETGESTGVVNRAVPSIGLVAPPGEVGPCVNVPIPNGVEPGSYRVVTDVGGRDEELLTAEIEVAGEPIVDEPLAETGTNPESPIEVLYEPAPTAFDEDDPDVGSKGNANVRQVEEAAEKALGGQVIIAWIGRDLPAPVARITLLDGTKADASELLKALRRDPGVDADRIGIDSSPFSRRELQAQADRVGEILAADEAVTAAGGYGYGASPHLGIVTAQVSEMTEASREEILALPGPPVRTDLGDAPVAF